MVLQFRTCSQCGESHALRRDGAMSIHQNAAGERCTEPSAPARTPARPKQRTQEPGRAERERAKRGQEKLTQLGDQTQLPKWQRDLERKAAFQVAAERKRGRGGAKKSDPMDRKIYAVGGIRTVNGGAPGGGKRR